MDIFLINQQKVGARSDFSPYYIKVVLSIGKGEKVP